MNRHHKHLAVRVFLLIGIALCGATAGQTNALGQEAIASTTLDVGQIVQRMEDRNKERSERLRHYISVRHYHVEYHGFPVTIAASMDVEATYDAPSSKSFRVLSQMGSGLLIDRVLKKLLKSEQEAARDQSRTALTTENYTFGLVGSEVSDGRRHYILQVEPKGDRKLLYRGRIWVDGNDYAVERIEAAPAQNPSLWIRKTEIHHVYSKIGDFWLPQQNKSETKVSIGGTAVLTIEYGAYRVEPPNM